MINAPTSNDTTPGVQGKGGTQSQQESQRSQRPPGIPQGATGIVQDKVDGTNITYYVLNGKYYARFDDGNVLTINKQRYEQVLKKSRGQSGQSRLTPQQAMDLQRRSDNLKPEDKPIVVTGIGSIQMGRNWMGQPVKKYFDRGGKELTKEEFNRRMQSILPQGSQIDLERQSDRPSRGSSVQAVPGTTHTFQGWTYFKGKDGKYYGTIAGKTTEISKEDWNTIIPRSQKVQGKQAGGLISPSKPNRAIPDSFAPYETPGGKMTFVFQPMIYYANTPSSSLRKIDFPSSIVNSTQASSFNRG